MSFLIQPSDLHTHIYGEIVSEITRQDAAITQAAIDTAIAEAKGFLSAFDLQSLFGTPDQDPAINDPNLKSKLKDIAVWQLITLGHPNMHNENAKKRYEYAIEYYFKLIQKGQIVPDGWQYKDADAAPAPSQGDAITWSSNPKRNNHY